MPRSHNSSDLPADNQPTGLPVLEAVNEYLNLGFQETDMQFNIGRNDGDIDGWGHDLVNPEDGSRVLITGVSSRESEHAIEQVFGSHSVFDSSGRQGVGAVVYEVPEGTRSLAKTLRSAPFSEAYMQRLKEHALGFIIGLGRLDPDVLGLDMNRFALTFDDDRSSLTHITVIPPVRDVSMETLKRYAQESTSSFEDTEYISIVGLQKAIKDLKRQNKRGVLTKIPHAERSVAVFDSWLQNEEEVLNARPLSGLLRSIGVVTNDTTS